MNPHLSELRSRSILSLSIFIVCFLICYVFSNQLYNLISQPILKQVAANTQIIATKVTSPFMIPLQLSFICALVICAPYLLYQLWIFVRPGLYPNERKNISKLVFSSCVLFYCGMIFSVLIICPVAMKFFTSSAPNGVSIMLDIADYLDFIVTITIACGFAFQIPIVTKVLLKSKILSKEQLKSKRKHVIVAAMVIGMLLAPPDVISQLLLSIPMWLLFELGLLLA